MQSTQPAAASPASPVASVAPAPPQPPPEAGAHPPGAADVHGAEATAGVLVAARAMPRTATEVAAIRQQRKWLSDQLVSAQERRSAVARALENARDPANRTGLEQRLQTLDRRIVQLEDDISETGRLLTTAPASAVLVTEARNGNPTPFDRGPAPTVVAIVFIVCVLLPTVITLCARFLRRSARPVADPAVRESAARLARLEQAVDAIAVEVERVSEGQRFVTRILADAREQHTAQAPLLNEYRPN